MVHHDTIARVTHAGEWSEREAEIAQLRYHWGGAYEISSPNGMFRAMRRDDGSAVSAPTADSHRTEIRADYHARAVPRSFHVEPPTDLG
jgi:hypothetical protein